MPEYRIDPRAPLPRYHQVRASLLARIDAGEFVPGAALPAERELATAYGVSRVTVIKALEELERAGYIERQHGRGTFVRDRARMPAAGAARSLALIAGCNAAEAGLVAAAAHAAARGYACQLLGWPGDLAAVGDTAPGDAAAAGDWLARRLLPGVCGVLSAGINGDRGGGPRALHQALAAAGLPWLSLDRCCPALDAGMVSYDEEAAGHDLTARLHAAGHRRIAVVAYLHVDVAEVRERITGYRRAIAGWDQERVWLDVYAGLAPHPAPDGHHTGAVLWQRMAEEQVTALIAANDDHVLPLCCDLLATARSGVRPPAVAGFSARWPAPHTPYAAIWAIRRPEELGRAAARLLIERVEGAGTAGTDVKLAPRIVDGMLNRAGEQA